MPPAAAIALSVAALKKPLEDLYGAAKGECKKKIKEWTTDARLKALHKSISSVQKVKVLWRIDKEVKLTSFYYPSKVKIGEQIKVVGAISEISHARSFVIQGTVGQGKSIFLRYLCIQELMASQHVPIMVELRRYDARATFREFLMESLRTYGLPCDAETFDYLAGSGKLVLLLDAFDEVDLTASVSVLDEIEKLTQQFPQLQMVITSRPDSGIERSPHFRVYQLMPLDSEDHRPFLEKIVDSRSRVAEILRAIKASGSEIGSLLQTPLLLTLLVTVYNATEQIPTSLSAFYDELMHTLLTRHDKTKPGFRRPRATRLEDTALRRLFEAFCYAARRRTVGTFTLSTFAKTLKVASEWTGIDCEPEHFARDLTKIACLMQEEGFELHFIHLSVAEFHAASFISNVSDDNALKFYTTALTDHSRLWRQELVFLSHIDRHRYLRYFMIPAIEHQLSYYCVDHESMQQIALNRSEAKRILNLYRISPNRSVSLPRFIGYHVEHRLASVVTDILSDLPELDEPLSAAHENFGDALARAGHLGQATSILNATLDRIREELFDARAEVQREQEIAQAMVALPYQRPFD
jgi:hypothetical protein